MNGFLSKLKVTTSNFFCYKQFSLEWLLYSIIILALMSFFIVSCYNADQLIKFDKPNQPIRNGVNIAIECVIIFIGFYLFSMWYRKTIYKLPVSDLQICFNLHLSIFLIMTGAAAMATTVKHIEKEGGN